MVKRIIKSLEKEDGSIHGAALLLAVSSLASGFLGLLRDRLLAGKFGAGETLDIYYASFRLPDLLYTISISLVSVTVLIPLFLKKKRYSGAGAKKLLDEIFTVFSIGLIVSALILYFLIPFLNLYLTPGFDAEKQKTLSVLSRILLLSPFFLGLSNLVSSVTQANKRFMVYALSPLVYNLSIIFGVVSLSPIFGVKGVVLGVITGSVLHLAVQLPTSRTLGFLPQTSLKIYWKDIKEIIWFSFPRSLGLTINQVVLSIMTALASVLSIGGIAIFNLANNLQSVAVGVIGVSFSVAAFPVLSGLDLEKEKDVFISHFRKAARNIVFYALPVTALFIVLRAQIVRVIFGYENFSWTDTRLTSAALALFSLSILAQMLVLFFSRVFYSAHKTLKPVLVNIFSAILTVALALWLSLAFANSVVFVNIFEKILRVENVFGTQALILPLAFSIGMIINALLLYYEIKKFFRLNKNFIKETITQSFFASLLMAFVTYGSLNVLDKFFDIDTSFGIFFQGFLSAFVGLAVWGTLLHRLKNEELMELIRSLKQKFWKTSVVIPEPQELP